VQRYKERENVGNHASPNIITVIRAGMITVNIPYFPAHKTHCDFFVRNFRKKIMMNVF